jgi:hypothetical protein
VGVKHEMTNGYARVEIEGSNVAVTYVHRTTPGVYVDTTDVFSYTLQPRLFGSATGGVLTLTWRGGGVLQVASEVGGDFAVIPEAASPYVITNLTEAQRFFRLRQP